MVPINVIEHLLPGVDTGRPLTPLSPTTRPGDGVVAWSGDVLDS
jgi:hypothetical protein